MEDNDSYTVRTTTTNKTKKTEKSKRTYVEPISNGIGLTTSAVGLNIVVADTMKIRAGAVFCKEL